MTHHACWHLGIPGSRQEMTTNADVMDLKIPLEPISLCCPSQRYFGTTLGTLSANRRCAPIARQEAIGGGHAQMARTDMAPAPSSRQT